MAAVNPHHFEPERVSEENKTSNDDSDASERLSCLNWLIAFVVNAEKLQESALLSRTAWIGKQVYGIYFMNFVLFCPLNMHATRYHLRIYMIRLVLKTPAVENRSLLYLTRINKGSNFFLLGFFLIFTSLLLFICLFSEVSFQPMCCK